MTASHHDDLTAPPLTRQENLLSLSTSGFAQFVDRLRPVKAALHLAADIGDPTVSKAASRLRQKLKAFEPSITMIGQIKSGKTTLVNSMTGYAGLLPADVNPWTSVVTSLHLQPDLAAQRAAANFRFFEAGEWDLLVQGGGRIGELADRAGADDELSTIKAQVEEMREKSRRRLGRKFEMLLGAEHRYEYVDAELVERYVCLGDDMDSGSAASKNQGRFADITKSADLMLSQRGLPLRMCIRDTPGVNDTFMMREQITIRAIRDSRTCVVVLSAHQALSSTDLAMVRLISAVSARDVVIFVNRIDELKDPATQVPQIRDSIVKTLNQHRGPADAQIVFGSALWAETASAGHVSLLPPASQEALYNWAEATNVPDKYGNDPNGLVWVLSGVPALFDALAEKVAMGVGKELLDEVGQGARNLLNGMTVATNLEARRGHETASLGMTPKAVEAALDTIRARHTATLQGALQTAIDGLADRSDRAHQSFLVRATEALAKHLELYGENSAWNYDPAGLRLLLSTAYKVFSGKCHTAYSSTLDAASADLRALCQRALDLPDGLFDPRFPHAPAVPAPVTLGQTIALDLRNGWWKGWWARRQSFEAQAQSYHELIRAETVGLLRDLVDDQAHEAAELMHSHVDRLLNEQCDAVLHTVRSAEDDVAQTDQLLGIASLEDRQRRIDDALTKLEDIAL